MLIINDKEYATFVVVLDVQERAEKVYGESPTMKQNGETMYDVIGTNLIHTVTFTKKPTAPAKETNELFTLLSNASEYLTVTLPHDENEITYKAHVSTAKRKLRDIINGKYIWDDDITAEFYPIEPQIRSD